MVDGEERQQEGQQAAKTDGVVLSPLVLKRYRATKEKFVRAANEAG
jgi:hypothetical protein